MRLLPTTLLLTLALAAPAAADSIVYVKDENVWVARPDGSEARALTTDGGYSSPSQADDGTVMAARGSRLYRNDRQGNKTALNTLLTDNPGSIGAVGPMDPKLSPDGTKVAYGIGIMGGWYDYATDTFYSDPQSAIAYQSALDGTPLGTTMFYEEPSWLPDGRVLLFDSLNAGVPQVVSGAVGANHNVLTPWFHDRDAIPDPDGWRPIGAGELRGSRLALLRAGGTMGAGYAARGRFNGIQVYRVSDLTTAPQPECWIGDQNGAALGPPSWSPNGDALAFETAAGIAVSPVCGVAPRLVIPGGHAPDWGPADPGKPAAPQPAAPQAGKPSLRAVKVRRGRVTVTVNCACTATVVARKGKRVVGRAKGTGKVTVKLRKRGRITLTIRAGGATFKRTVRVR